MKPKSPQNTNRKVQLRRDSYESKHLHKHMYAFHNIRIFLNSFFLPQILHSLDFNLFGIFSAVISVTYIGSRKNLVIFLLKHHYKVRIFIFTVRYIFHKPKFRKFLISLKYFIYAVNLIYRVVSRNFQIDFSMSVSNFFSRFMEKS